MLHYKHQILTGQRNKSGWIFLTFMVTSFIVLFHNVPVARSYGASAFVMTVKTDNPGTSTSTQFTIPTAGVGYNYSVDCNDDGVNEATGQVGNYTCTYATAGTYTVAITGTFPRIFFANLGDRRKVLTIAQWGTGAWSSMVDAFYGCSNLTVTATDTPNLSAATSLSQMFRSASALTTNAAMNTWNTSTITNMSGMFRGATLFNQNIGAWDTTNVTNMSAMFSLSGFNQDISTWNTSSLTNIGSMFANATAFNKPLNTWNTSSVTTMNGIFQGATAFNQPLSSWDVSGVTDMTSVFASASAFNQDISAWDTSNVTLFTQMFNGATNFNQPIGSWNTSSATNLNSMFAGALAFNQNLAGWDVADVTTASLFLSSATLSVVNYDALLTSWSAQAVQTAVPFHGGASQYCAASARAILTSAPKNWTITDGGPCYSLGGTVYTDEGTTPIGSGRTVRLLINGSSALTTLTTSTGAYYFAAPKFGNNDIITVHLDGAELGVTVTRGSTANITNLHIYQDRLIVRSETVAALTHANLNTANDGDPEITAIYADGASFVTGTDKKLIVWTGKQFTPGVPLDLNGGVRIQAGGNLTAAANAITVGGTTQATSEFINLGSFSSTAGTSLTFDGTSPIQMLRFGAAAANSNIIVANTVGVVTLSGGVALNASSRTITIQPSATLFINGQNISIGTLSNNGTFRLRGSETLTFVNDIDSGTFEYRGDGDGLADNFNVANFGINDFYNLRIASADTNDTFRAIAGTTMLGSFEVTQGTYNSNNFATTVTGVVTISGGTYNGSTVLQTHNSNLMISGGVVSGSNFDVNGALILSSGSMSVTTSLLLAGDFTHTGGTFTPSTSTVTLDGCNQTKTGSTTFYSLSKNEASNDATDCTLTLDHSAVQTVTNTLSLRGLDADDRLNIVSNSGGNQADFLLSGASANLGAIRVFLDITDNAITKTGGSAAVFPVNPSNSINGGNTMNWFTASAPVVTNVTSSTTNGTYGLGQVISVQITFDTSVTVTGIPRILLETGATDRYATFVSGSPGTTLTFQYTVQAGDVTADLDATATTSLELNGGTINATTGGTPATLTLASPGVAGSLGNNKGIVIDGNIPAAPGTPDLLSGSDTGGSNTDNVTTDTTPTFDIACETGATVQLYSGAILLGSGTCVAGTVNITSPFLVAGVYPITATQTDAAGNISVSSSALSVTITTASTAPGTPDLQSGSDTGSSPSDDLTNDTTPTIDVSCTAGATVEILSGATLLATGTCSVGGTISLTVTPPLVDGTYSITARQDTGGGFSPLSSVLTITIDATPPVITGAPDLQSGSDTGSSSTDNATSDDTPTFDIVCVTGTTVSLYSGATLLGTGSCVGGTVSITSVSLSSSTYTFTALQTDTAGNSSPTSGSLVVIIDTGVPAAPGTPDLQAGSDTGISPTDNATSDTTPSFTITCETGTTVELYAGVLLVESGTCVAGTVTITLPSGLSDGSYSFTALQRDSIGFTSPSSAGLIVIIDGTPPISPSLPDLQSGSDTGTSSIDNITSDTTPTFDVTSCEPGAIVRLLSGATIVASGTCTAGGTVTLIVSPALADGVYPLMIDQQDPAGNISPAAGPLSITIDTTPSAAPGITSPTVVDTVNNPTIVVGTCVTGETVQVSSPSLVSSVTGSCVAGTFSIPVTWNGGTTGSNTITVKQFDPAGNQSPTATVVVTVDIQPPLGTPDLDSGSDTGVSNSDNITADTTPTFNITCTVGATVDIMSGATLLASGVCPGTATIALTITTDLGEGSYTINSRENAGPLSTSFTFTVIDTVAPSAPGTPDLSPDTDGGDLDTDDITNDDTPTVSVSCEAGTIVTVYEGATALGSATCVSGVASVTLSTLMNGLHTLTAKQEDPAGNVSSTSGGLPVTIDTLSPSAPGTPDLQSGSDTGASTTDNVTTDATPTFDVSCESGATVRLYSGATLLGTGVCTGGTVSITSSTLIDGSYTFTVTQTDVAGNLSPTSSALIVTIDTAPPGVPGTPDLDSSSDTGSSSTDNLTNDSTPLVTLNCESTRTVSIYSGTTLLGTGTCVAGSASITLSTLIDGHYTLTAIQYDTLGNGSPVSGGLTIQVDLIAPVTPSVPTTNNSLTDTPMFSGTCSTGDLISIYDGAIAVGSAACIGGLYNITVSTLSRGTHTISALATDLAGNNSSFTIPASYISGGTSISGGGGGGSRRYGAPGSFTSVSTLTPSSPVEEVNGQGMFSNTEIQAFANRLQGVEFPSTDYQGKCIDHLDIKKLLAADIPYTDVGKSSWYFHPIQLLTKGEVVHGMRDTQGKSLYRFEPERVVNYAEGAAMLFRAAKEPLRPDPIGDRWYEPYIEQAEAYGLSQYLDATEPYQELTRAVAVPLVLTASCLSPKVPESFMMSFSDLTSAHRRFEIIRQAAFLEVVTGYGDGTFRPDQTITRAEFGAMILRALKVRYALQVLQ